MTGECPNFVFYLSSEWETFHRPHMLRAMARCAGNGGGRVLLVDRMMCPFSGALRGFRHPTAGRLRGIKEWGRTLARSLTGRQVEQLDDNLYLCRTMIFLNDWQAHGIGATPALNLNRRLLRRQLASILRRVGFDGRPLVTWFHSPLWVHYVGMLREDLRVYECYDEHAETAGLSRTAAQRIRILEKELLRRVDLAFTTSQALLVAKSLLHRRVYCVPNAADFSYYSRVQDASQPVDAELARLPHPIVGFLGNIKEDTGLGLLRYVAEQRPNWSVVVAGRVEHRGVLALADFQRLQKLPNVRFLGWVDRSRHLSVCKAFDVGIIPYDGDSIYNRYVNPTKLHEYTAMGKPIVAMEGAEMDSHRDLIFLAKSPEEFLVAIEAAYQSDSPEKIEQRLQFAKSNSWDARVRTMMNRVMELIQENAVASVRAGVELPV